MADFPLIEALESLRIVTCPECAAIHAIPGSLFLTAKSDQKPIHCPNGHAWTPTPFTENEVYTNSRRMNELQDDVVDARTKLQAAMRRIEVLTPLAEPTPKEFLRRSRLIAEKAEQGPNGRVLCPFCGNAKSQLYLAEHIRRRHKGELIEAPKTL